MAGFETDGFEEFEEMLGSLSGGDDEVTYWVGSAQSYAPHVEYGTGPHTSSEGQQEFKENITEWANSKGLPVYPIMQSIRESGTEAQPHLRPALNEVGIGFYGINIFQLGGVEMMLRASALKIAREAKINAPVHNGALRSSYAIGSTKSDMLENSESSTSGS